MYHGDEKRLQMARSILPSTKRGFQHARRRIHKQERAAVRADLRGALGAPDVDAWTDDRDASRRRTGRIRSMVWDRQVGDKLGPMFRWATAATAHLRVEDRLPFLRAVLPKGLVGDHALSHLVYLPHFRDAHRRLVEEAAAARRARAWKPTTRPRALRAALLREVVIDGAAHRRLHAWLRAAHLAAAGGASFLHGPVAVSVHAPVTVAVEERARATPVRLLAGLGDLEAFLDAIEAASVPRGRYRVPTHPAWSRALEAFLDAWIAAGRDAERLPDQVAV